MLRSSAFQVLTMLVLEMIFLQDAPRPKWSDLCSSVSEAKGTGKLKTVSHFYTEWRARGEWNSDNAHARHWGFVLGAMSKLGFIYAFFLLFKRMYISATMEFSDGKPNAVLAVLIQTLDSILLLALRPFNDSQETLTEALSGISNTGDHILLPNLGGRSSSVCFFVQVAISLSTDMSVVQVPTSLLRFQS